MYVDPLALSLNELKIMTNTELNKVAIQLEEQELDVSEICIDIMLCNIC